MMHVPLSEIIVLQKGKKPKTQSAEMLEGFIPYVDIKAFEQGVFDSYTDGKGCSFCDEDDILIVCDGSRSGLVGRAKQGAIGSTLAKVSAPSFIDKKFLFYFIQKHYLQLNTNPKGTGTPHVNPKLLGSFPFPILSTNGQERIADKIDSLFSKLDNGVEMLHTIHQQLKTYRQAVLKWAFEGKDWELVPFSPQIASFVTSGSRGWAQYYSDTGAKFIRIGNLTRDGIKLLLDDVQCVTLPDKAEGLRSLLLHNDMLISITADLGSIGIVPTDFGEAYINQHIALTRLKKPLLVMFYAWYLKSETGRKELLRNKRGGTKVGLGLDDVRDTRVPLVSDDEAFRIVSEIESRLSVCDKIETIVAESLSQAEALKQSILKKAFAGELVSQDPDDEPAEKLLERIKAAKKAAVAINKPTRRKN